MQAGCVAGPLYGTVTICRGRFRETLWAGDIQYDSRLHSETHASRPGKTEIPVQASPEPASGNLRNRVPHFTDPFIRN